MDISSRTCRLTRLRQTRSALTRANVDYVVLARLAAIGDRPLRGRHQAVLKRRIERGQDRVRSWFGATRSAAVILAVLATGDGTRRAIDHHRVLIDRPPPYRSLRTLPSAWFRLAAVCPEGTGFDETDLALLFEAPAHMFELDRSVTRGEMTMRAIIAFKHGSALRNAAANKPFERVTVRRVTPHGPCRQTPYPTTNSASPVV